MSVNDAFETDVPDDAVGQARVVNDGEMMLAAAAIQDASKSLHSREMVAWRSAGAIRRRWRGCSSWPFRACGTRWAHGCHRAKGYSGQRGVRS